MKLINKVKFYMVFILETKKESNFEEIKGN
jgi:hypothetical protein